MALQTAGLGFSFAVEDTGLEAFPAKISEGFLSMASAVEAATARMSEAMNPIREDLGEFLQPAMPDDTFQAMQEGLKGLEETLPKLNVSIDKLIDHLKEAKGVTEDEKFLPAANEGMEELSDKTADLGKSTKQTGVWMKEMVASTLAGIGKMASGFSGLQGSLDKLTKITGLSALGNAVSAIGSKMAGVPGALGGILKPNLNLTSGLEAEAASTGKAAKQITAQLGLSGAEAKAFSAQIASAAMSTMIDVKTMGDGFYNFKWAAKEFAAVGVTSGVQLAKFSEVFGVESGELATNLKTLSTRYKFGEKDLATFVGSLQAFGQETGSMPKAFGNLQSTLEAIQGVTDATGKSLEGAQLASYAKETVALARGFYSMSQNSEGAMKTAQELATAIGKNREGYSALFTGVDGDYGELMTSLNKMGVSSTEAFDLMQQGPEGFMRGMSKLVTSAQSTENGIENVDFVLVKMKQLLGKVVDKTTADDMMNMFKNATPEMWQAMDAIKGTKAELGKLGDEGHSTGMTLADTFERSKQAFLTQFRAIGIGGAQKFVKDTSAAFNTFGKNMAALAAEGGPMGTVVTKLSEIHSLGSLALIPESLRPLASIVGTLTDELGSMMMIIGPLIPVFGGALIPIAALALPLGLLVLRISDLAIQGKSTGEIWIQLGADLQKAANEGLNYVAGAVDNLYKKFQDIDWSALFGRIVEAINGLFAGKGTGIDPMTLIFGGGNADLDASNKLGKIGGQVSEMVGKIATALVDAASEIDWGKMVEGLLAAWARGREFAIKMVVGIVDAILKILPELIPAVLSTLMGLADTLVSALGTLGARIPEVIDKLVIPLLEGFAGLVEKVVPKLGVLLSSIFTALVKAVVAIAVKLPDILDTLVPAIVTGLQTLIGSLVKQLPVLVGALITVVKSIVAKLPEWIPIIITGLTTLLPELFDAVVTVIGLLAKELPTIVGFLLDGVVQLILSLAEQLPVLLPQLIEAFKTIFITVLEMLPELLPLFIMAIETLVGGITLILPELMPTLVDALVTLIIALIPVFWDVAWEVGPTIFKLLFWDIPWKIVPQLLAGLIMGLWNILENLMYDYIIKPIGDIIVLLSDPFNEAIDAIVLAWDGLWLKIDTFSTDVKASITTALTAVQTEWNRIWKELETTVDDVRIWLEGVFTGFFDPLLNSVWKVVIGIQVAFIDAFLWIVGQVRSIADAIPEALRIGPLADLPAALEVIETAAKATKDSLDALVVGMDATGPASEAQIGHSIQWDWYDALAIMDKSLAMTAGQFGLLQDEMGATEGATELASATMDANPLYARVGFIDEGTANPMDQMQSGWQDALVQPIESATDAMGRFLTFTLLGMARVGEAWNDVMTSPGGFQVSPEARETKFATAVQELTGRPRQETSARSATVQPLPVSESAAIRELAAVIHDPNWYGDWKQFYGETAEKLLTEVKKLNQLVEGRQAPTGPARAPSSALHPLNTIGGIPANGRYGSGGAV